MSSKKIKSRKKRKARQLKRAAMSNTERQENGVERARIRHKRETLGSDAEDIGQE